VDEYVLRPIGHVASPLRDTAQAPKQAHEGAPAATIVVDTQLHEAMRDLAPGDEILVLTWLDRADRNVQTVHPRDDRTQPRRGVFSTRSADRPNPIGVHRVRIAGIADSRITVDALEAIDGTPVVDIKPVLP
jgi:tRNA-Thr(GGU) m(6)t(6)A37 methyltransferase TsaA